MRLLKTLPTLTAVAASAVLASSVLPIGAARAQQPTYVMKISTPTIHDIPDKWAANLAAALEKDSGGKVRHPDGPAGDLSDRRGQ